jgi:hypothetical protein
MDHLKKLFLLNGCMTQHLVKMVISIKNINQKNLVFFMTHAFSQSEHPFGQCGHFNQVEPFENHDFL